jgi:hypothetical protein
MVHKQGHRTYAQLRLSKHRYVVIGSIYQRFRVVMFPKLEGLAMDCGEQEASYDH